MSMDSIFFASSCASWNISLPASVPIWWALGAGNEAVQASPANVLLVMNVVGGSGAHRWRNGSVA